MTMGKHEITVGDLMSVEAYTKARKERRAALVQRKKQRRVKLWTPLCLDNGETGSFSVKLEGDWLKQDRVMDSPIRTGPVENPISDHQLNRFALAVDPPSKFVEFFEDLHRFARRALVLRPLRSRCTP